MKINDLLNNITFSNTEEDSLFHINSIEFKNISFLKDTVWKIEKLRCSNLSFNNFRNFGIGNIDNTKSGYFKPLSYKFKELIDLLEPLNDDYATFFVNRGIIDSNLKPQRSLTFNQSDFGKLNFIDTDFSDFNLNFYSTKLNEIFLAGSKMPKTVDALDIEDIDPFHQQRIANSQLKKLHEQQGDIVAANEYFANEMNAYYSSLQWNLPKDRWEKLPLWFNRISSNHGQSWTRALRTTLMVSCSFYFFFCLLLGFYPANPLKLNNWLTFWQLFSYYLEFINPVHKLDSFDGLVNKTPVSASAKILDGISRIFNSYFIYQLIQAFRKHGRSK